MQALDTKLQRDFGIAFEDKTLLETAFTHTSYANEHRLLNISHNERFGIFRRRGSSTFDFSVFVQKISEETRRLILSKMRSVIVREESLAGFSRYCGFDEFIKLGNGEEKSGGRNRDTILGDLFEAFLGALLMDQGVEAVNKFLNQVMIPQVEKGNFERVKDYKTTLQELLQGHGDVTIDYRVSNESGPAHAKVFEVTVYVNDEAKSKGIGKSKKLAEQDAAKNALATLQ